MKKLVLIFALVASVFAAEQKPLVVGMELGYPPFEMSDNDGKPAGISVDLMNEYAKFANRKIKIENIAWKGLIPALKTGKIDMIISSMTITKERAKTIDFTIPYAQANLAILTPINSGINSIGDLNQKGKKLALKKGSTGHLYAVKNLPNAEILLFDKENAAILEVIQCKADGFLYDQLTIYRNWHKHQDKTKAILQPFQKTPEYWGIAVKKGNTELLDSLNAFIKEAKEKKIFDSLGEKYLHDVKKTFKEQNIEFFF